MKTIQLTMIKIARAQYQVIDENGKEQFAYPTSQHECNMLIMGTKADAKFLANERMKKVAMKFINDYKLPVSAYGDLYQFMVNSIYKMYHRDIIELMKRKEFYRDHLEKMAVINRTAREKSLNESTSN
jgi:hypothetical protein